MIAELILPVRTHVAHLSTRRRCSYTHAFNDLTYHRPVVNPYLGPRPFTLVRREYCMRFIAEVLYNIHYTPSGVFRGGGRESCAWPPVVWEKIGVLLLLNFSNLFVNFLWCILKTVLIRSSFQPKMHYISFGGGALPGPTGRARAFLQTPAGREPKGREMGWKYEDEEREEQQKGKGGGWGKRFHGS